jgi:hypothetical protein
LYSLDFRYRITEVVDRNSSVAAEKKRALQPAGTGIFPELEMIRFVANLL